MVDDTALLERRQSGQDFTQASPAGFRSTDSLLPGPELTVVVPTFNEEGNVEALVQRLREVLRNIHWEVIFVDDDSSDGTRQAARRVSRLDGRIRLLHRIGRRGLASACVEGIQASTAPYVAVMDADLQHDENLLPRMLSKLRGGSVDIVVGSRYVPEGDARDWDPRRAQMSLLATRAGQLVLKARVEDPMSGFFMLRRELFDSTVRGLSAIGFKILLDILASADQPVRLEELPYHFRQRLSGESKLDAMVAGEYLLLLIDKTVGKFVPARFVMFSLIGLLGLGVHLVILGLLLNVAHILFAVAQATATVVAMIGNFTLNNWLTYRDKRLHGWGFARGLLSFALVCGFGALANVGLASFLFGHRQAWWLAGIAGAAMSSVWNYAVSSLFTWKAR
jgi:dolichol-phosphate mannosyltransferase